MRLTLRQLRDEPQPTSSLETCEGKTQVSWVRRTKTRPIGTWNQKVEDDLEAVNDHEDFDDLEAVDDPETVDGLRATADLEALGVKAKHKFHGCEEPKQDQAGLSNKRWRTTSWSCTTPRQLGLLGGIPLGLLGVPLDLVSLSLLLRLVLPVPQRKHLAQTGSPPPLLLQEDLGGAEARALLKDLRITRGDETTCNGLQRHMTLEKGHDAPYFLFGREKKVKAPIQAQGAVTLQEMKLRELCLFPTYEEPSSTMAEGSPSGHTNFTIEVGGIMKNALNMYPNATISEDAIADVQGYITNLIAIISSEAVHKAELAKHMELEKRMDLESAVGTELAKYFITVNEKFTVTADHVESALDTLSLDAMTTRKS
nr:uncharacterized protein LOC109158871 [Ipomoea batatas]